MAKEKDTPQEKIASALSSRRRASPRALAREYLDKHIQGRQSLGLPREKVFDPRDPFDWQSLKETFRRLPLETQERLKANYDTAVILHIVETILNFRPPIIIAEKSKTLVKDMKKGSLLVKGYALKAISDVESLLANPLLILPENLKDSLVMVKEISEKIRDLFKTTKTDEVGFAKLYDVFIDPLVDLTSSRDMQWYRQYLTQLLFLELEQREGRPPKMFSKALQIIIYRLLTDNAPRTVNRPIQWAKELAATIINESYAGWGLLKLTAKDIDNSVHSSS